jgi:hypothetical protein
MRLLEKLGFIRSQEVSNQKHRYVLMIDPGVAVAALQKKGLVDAAWLATYDARRIATKEAQPAKPPGKKAGGTVVPIASASGKVK